MNGSADNMSQNGNTSNLTWTSKTDPGVELQRHIVEVWLTTPIVLLGIAGNVVAFFVLCQHRRHKLQTTTAILQVTRHHHTALCFKLTRAYIMMVDDTPRKENF